MKEPKNAIRNSIDLGAALERIRRTKELTQKEVGQQAVVKQALISTLESGAAGTRLSTLFKVLAALNLEIVLRPRRKSNWTPEDML